MTESEFLHFLQTYQGQINNLVNRRLPILIGRAAKTFFDNSFRQSAFTDVTPSPWAVTRRQQNADGSADSKYSPLCSSSNHLASSTQYVPGQRQVTISNPVPYAHIHNSGGSIDTHPSVTPKMRKFAWAKYFKAHGKGDHAQNNPEADKWKALALTKKNKLDIHVNIPKRQFMGPSQQLNTIIQDIIAKEINNLK